METNCKKCTNYRIIRSVNGIPHPRGWWICKSDEVDGHPRSQEFATQKTECPFFNRDTRERL